MQFDLLHVDEVLAEAELLFKGVLQKEPATITRFPLQGIRSIFARQIGAEEDQTIV